MQAQLKRTEIDVQQMIRDREKKMEEIKHSVELNKVRERTSGPSTGWTGGSWPTFSSAAQASAQREIEESVQVFSELVRSIQRTQAELVVSIEEKQRQTERWAGGFVAELEQEVADLTRRKKELENMARTDHIHFLKVTTLHPAGAVRGARQLKLRLISLQNFPALCTSPPVKDWSETNVPTDVCVGMIRKSVSKLEATLQEMIDKLAQSGETYFSTFFFFWLSGWTT